MRHLAVRDAISMINGVSSRWASNLRTYDAPEPRRFVEYYDAMSAGSALLLVRASAQSQSPE